MAASKRWIALLRAVNLGGRNRVPMVELRQLCEELGFESVRTYIASGNVVFTAGSARAALARTLETGVAERFGVPTVVMLRTAAELRTVLGAHPFGKDTSQSVVTFLERKPAATAVRQLAALDFAPDEAKIAGTHVYIRYPNGAGQPKLSGARLERTLGVAGTARTWRTVAQLAELAETI